MPDIGGAGVIGSSGPDGDGVGGDVGMIVPGGVVGDDDSALGRAGNPVQGPPLALSAFQKSGVICIKSGVWPTSRRRSLSTMISSLYCMALRFGKSLSLAPHCSVGIQVSGRAPMERSLT